MRGNGLDLSSEIFSCHSSIFRSPCKTVHLLEAIMWACQQQKAPREFSISRAIVDVCSSASFRALRAASNIQYALFSALFVLPKASADYPNLSNNTSSNYNDFTPSQSNDSRVLADISNFKATSIGFPEWQAWAHTIRASGGVAQCVGNLSIALSEVGSAYAASSNGASTLLTLIPTASALIGAPARELWVLYKLMPIAGILSMMLSLGGNIVPMDISDYEQVDTFSYAGMIPTADQKTNSFVAKSTGETEAERFAALVHSRARDKLGARRSVAIWFGILLQCFWLTCILIACWFLDSGSIIVWWCTVSRSAFKIEIRNYSHLTLQRTTVGCSSGLASSPCLHSWRISQVFPSPDSGRFESPELHESKLMKALPGQLSLHKKTMLLQL